MAYTTGSEYPSSTANRAGQTLVYNINTSEATNQTIFTIDTEEESWGSSTYTKILVRGTYGCVSRRIKTIN